MKIATLLIIALFTAAIPGSAAPAPTPAPTTPLAALEKKIEDVRLSSEKVRQCFGAEKALRADHARKKAELTAEFKGKIWPAFDLLLIHKIERAGRLRQVCIEGQKAVNELLEQAHSALRNYEPRSTDLSSQKSRLDSVQASLRNLMAPGRASSAQ